MHEHASRRAACAGPSPPMFGRMMCREYRWTCSSVNPRPAHVTVISSSLDLAVADEERPEHRVARDPRARAARSARRGRTPAAGPSRRDRPRSGCGSGRSPTGPSRARPARRRPELLLAVEPVRDRARVGVPSSRRPSRARRPSPAITPQASLGNSRSACSTISLLKTPSSSLIAPVGVLGHPRPLHLQRLSGAVDYSRRPVGGRAAPRRPARGSYAPGAPGRSARSPRPGPRGSRGASTSASGSRVAMSIPPEVWASASTICSGCVSSPQSVVRFDERVIGSCPARHHARGPAPRARQERHGRGVDRRRDATRPSSDACEVPHAARSRSRPSRRVAPASIIASAAARFKRRHHLDGAPRSVPRSRPGPLDRGRDDAEPERLREEQSISRAHGRVPTIRSRRRAQHDHAVLRLGVGDRMPPDDRAPALSATAAPPASTRRASSSGRSSTGQPAMFNASDRRPAHRVDVARGRSPRRSVPSRTGRRRSA